jgi:hypothetical protein
VPLQPIGITGWKILVDESKNEFIFGVGDKVTFKKGGSIIRARVDLSRSVENERDVDALAQALGHVQGVFSDTVTDEDGSEEMFPLVLTSEVGVAVGKTSFDVAFVTSDKKWTKKVTSTAPGAYSLSLTWPGDAKPAVSQSSSFSLSEFSDEVPFTVRPDTLALVGYGVAIERGDDDLDVRPPGPDGAIRFRCASDEKVKMVIFAMDQHGNPIEDEGQPRRPITIAASAAARQRVAFVSSWSVMVRLSSHFNPFTCPHLSYKLADTSRLHIHQYLLTARRNPD